MLCFWADRWEEMMQNTVFDMGDFVNKKASAQTAFNFSFQNRPLPQKQVDFCEKCCLFLMISLI
jgi:hypothetical protein